MKAPKPNTEFRIHRGHLALFHAVDDHTDYWESYWTPEKRTRLTRAAEGGSLGEFEEVIEEYVPRELPILEAGCGPAHLVMSLQSRGYSCTGIDYEASVVRFVNKTIPDLDVTQGDVRNLPLQDKSLGCYLSLGVLEHFECGPQEALNEVSRVLHPRGHALISVPYLNPIRQRYRPKPSLECQQSDLHFHQYYFSRSTFEPLLQRVGLRIIDTFPYAVEAFLIREHRWFSRFWTSPLARERIKSPLRKMFMHAPSWMRKRYAHMIMFICQISE